MKNLTAVLAENFPHLYSVRFLFFKLLLLNKIGGICLLNRQKADELLFQAESR